MYFNLFTVSWFPSILYLHVCRQKMYMPPYAKSANIYSTVLNSQVALHVPILITMREACVSSSS